MMIRKTANSLTDVVTAEADVIEFTYDKEGTYFRWMYLLKNW